MIKSCLKVACMLAFGGLTYKVGSLNTYTLRNDNFHCSFYVTDDHGSFNMSTAAHLEHHFNDPKGFNVNIALMKDGSATVQYIDKENRLYKASLQSIIECANEFERTH